jgi:hypothetical protein
MTQPYEERPVARASAEEVRAEETSVEETSVEEVPVEEVPVEEVPVEEVPVEDVTGPPDDAGFGDPRVDDAVARLQELSDRPVGEHAEVFDDIHRRLRDALEEAAVEPAEEPRG